jgi:hypothetical protein
MNVKKIVAKVLGRKCIKMSSTLSKQFGRCQGLVTIQQEAGLFVDAKNVEQIT